MRARPVLVLSIPLALILGGVPARADVGVETWPAVWRVNGNGETGSLELSLRHGGTLEGRLLNDPVKGFVVGRRLLLRRETKGGLEVWEGWLSEPRPGGEPGWILAGTFSVTAGGETRVYPWYATPATEGPPDAGSAAPAPGIDETATSAGTTTESALEAAAPRGDGGLSGTWTSLTGDRFVVRQDGQDLTVILADGSSRAGRMTGSSTLVVGLRQGCCNGKLEGANTIVWSDGARWLRDE